MVWSERNRLNKIRLFGGLPFVEIDLCHNGKHIRLSKILLDTGSAGTLLSIEHAFELDLDYTPSDQLRRVHGVGGAEFVFVKKIDHVALADMICLDFAIQIGDMDYGMSFDGIIGVDFLMQVKARLDFGAMQIYATTEP
jgi:hypothetical protein